MSWSVTIYRQTNDGSSPATTDSPCGAPLAAWQETSLFSWMDELVKLGKAIDLGGDGYPCRFTATANDLIAQIPTCSVDETPEHRRILKQRDGTLAYFQSGHEFDPAAVSACRPDEWLLLEAWDNS